MSRSLKNPIFWALLVLMGMAMACGGPAPEKTPTEIPILAPTEEPTVPATEAPIATEAPAQAGSSPDAPLPRAETLVTPDWEIQVLEVLRGDEAMALLEQASPFNKPHKDPNMEYTLVRLRVKYIGADAAKHIYGKVFRSLGSAGEIYDAVSFIDIETPAPELEADLPPGGETEGWVAIQIGKEETGMILVVWPYDSYENNTAIFSDSAEKWYISLEP